MGKVLAAGTKLKRREHPVGRLGRNVKQGINLTYAAFFNKYYKSGLPRVGQASIRP